MAIYRLLKNSTFGTREAAAMAKAYERVLSELGITDRSDPRTETLALAIAVLVREGETDSTRLAQLAAKAIAPPRPSDTGQGAQD
jgi:hypothetical protein